MKLFFAVFLICLTVCGSRDSDGQIKSKRIRKNASAIQSSKHPDFELVASIPEAVDAIEFNSRLLISLSNLVAMGKIQKNIKAKVRPVGEGHY